MKNKLRIVHAAIVAASMAGGSALAATVTWTGSGFDGLYSNTNNWDTLLLPTAVDDVTMSNGDSILYTDGVTNTVDRAFISGNTIVNFSGGFWNHDRSGNTIRTFLGTGGTAGTINQSGGMFRIGHALWITEGSDFNLSGGELEVYRGSNTGVGGGLPNGASISIGRTASIGNMKITGGSLSTRGAIEIGALGTFEVSGGSADFINLGNQSFGNGDGAWYQTSNATLRVGISTNGVTPIVLNDTGADGLPQAILFKGSILDVSFIDGAEETNAWPIIDLTAGGSIANNGMVFDAGVDTNDWGFIVSNNTLWVGYGLGWPAGQDIITPPTSGRDLYWVEAVDTDSSNPTNWVLNLDGSYTNETIWAIYKDDTLHIGNANAVAPGTPYVMDYDGTAPFVAQSQLYIGEGAEGTYNHNSGELSFGLNNSISAIGTTSVDGKGTLNVNGGILSLNALRMGLGGGQGYLNVNGGTFKIGRAWGNNSMYIGYGSAGTVTVKGGRLFTRAPVQVGFAGGEGIFCVEGSEASEIGIGSEGTVDGAWYQNETGTLKIRVDAGGVTPISIINKDEPTGGFDGHVYFYDGALLDIDWMPGVTNYGTFDIMTWDGELMTNALAFSSNVDASVWSYEIVDANLDGTNDTLRATAYGETANGTPIPWLNSYGLNAGDDEVDNDGDGLLTWQEYVAGTDPTDDASVLAVTSAESIAGGNFVITWQSVEDRNYSVITNLDLVFGTPGIAASGIQGQPVETSYTSSVPAASVMFFEIGVTNN
ncbi:hypothetical protein P4E94_00890 [Pontiellaceae bacterium B12219]|nr:hypothetical protein [Pontiellaceae bacterium B12219]